MVQNQGLQVQKIEPNPGLLPINIGQAFKQEDKWTVIKVLDLSRIDTTLEFNLQKYAQFSNLVDRKNQYSTEFLALRKQVDYLRSITIDKLRQLLPTIRIKRGILNPLGSMIKLITGNLDHEDANHYDSLITQINNKQILTDKKITVISKMLDTFINSTETLQTNTKILDEKLRLMEELVKKTINNEVNSAYSTHILMMFNIFCVNFRSIYITLSEIETALALSKVSVLHQSIVNSTELLIMLKTINYTENLMYEPSASNLVMLEKMIAVKAFMKGNQITFILEIPLTDGNIYNYFKLYAFPKFNDIINKTLTVIPKFPYLMVKGLKHLPVAHSCEEIGENQYLCTEDSVATYTGETCVEQLMKFRPNISNCNTVSVDVENTKVQRIKNNDWIVYIRNEIILKEICGDNVTYKSLRGSFILHVEENCVVFLENIRLQYRRFYSNIITRLTPITDLPILQSSTVALNKTLDMKEINFDDLKQLSYMLKAQNSESESVESENFSAVKIHSISLATVLLYVILPICVLGYIMFKYRLKLFTFTRNNPNPVNPNSDNFALREGEVMHPIPHSIITVRA